MRETLVRYLLGELGDEERREVETQLAVDGQLRSELDQIRACLFPEDGELDNSTPPPSDLADRTARCISASPGGDGLPAPSEQDGVDAPVSASRVTFVDACVAVGVVMAVGMMFLPALGESRERARRTTCENNMRAVGFALVGYSNEHNGFFPYIEPSENAGMFAVRLAESGMMSKRELSRRLVCSERAGERSQLVVVVVPNRDELNRARGSTLLMYRRNMGGRYAYRVGYVDHRRYYAIRNHSSSRSPILSDAPTSQRDGWVSLNHGGSGQNVLFQDGSVRYLTDRRGIGLDDNLFTNTAGMPAAGTGADDAVLLRSEMTPSPGHGVAPVMPAALRAEHAGW